LVAAAGLAIFLAMSWEEMPMSARIGIIVAIVISTFMYSFRRMIRIKLEQADREEEAQLIEEEEERND
jgi:uncharacterized membrane protein